MIYSASVLVVGPQLPTIKRNISDLHLILHSCVRKKKGRVKRKKTNNNIAEQMLHRPKVAFGLTYLCKNTQIEQTQKLRQTKGYRAVR